MQQGFAPNAVFLDPDLQQQHPRCPPAPSSQSRTGCSLPLVSVPGTSLPGSLFWGCQPWGPAGFVRSDAPQHPGWVDVSSHPITCLGKRQGVLLILRLLMIHYSHYLSSRNSGQGDTLDLPAGWGGRGQPVLVPVGQAEGPRVHTTQPGPAQHPRDQPPLGRLKPQRGRG